MSQARPAGVKWSHTHQLYLIEGMIFFRKTIKPGYGMEWTETSVEKYVDLIDRKR